MTTGMGCVPRERFAKYGSRYHNKHLPAFQKTRPPCSGPVVLAFSIVLGLLSAACHSENAGRPPLNAQEQRGKAIYDARCISCHDPDSDKPRQGPGLARVFRKKYLSSGLPATDEHARNAIRMGRGTMPGFQAVLDDGEISDLVAYLHTL
jgi:mono/diheme cytochrome c family protein